MTTNNPKVTIILSDISLDRLCLIGMTSHIWIIESPLNIPIIDSFSKWPDFLDPDNEFSLSYLGIRDYENSEAAIFNLLDCVLDHHPECHEYFIIGVKFTDSIRNALKRIEATEVKTEKAGIRFRVEE